MRGLRGSVAWIVGAACPPGIGRATALRLAEEGAAALLLTERVLHDDEPADTASAPAGALQAVADEVVEASGGRTAVHALALRCEEPGEAQRAVREAVTRFGRLDHVVVVEGGLGPALGDGPLVGLSAEGLTRCLAVNLVGAWAAAAAGAEAMVARGGGGSIVLMSSWAAAGAPRPGIGAFTMAKAALERLVRDLADEVGPQRIRVNGVRPLGVDPSAVAPAVTGAAAATHANPYLDRSATAALIALGRLQAPTEMASAIAYLLSDDASFVTGHLLDVTGGARG